MLKEDNLKVGTCIIQDCDYFFREGIICHITRNLSFEHGYQILWFYQRKEKHSFAKYYTEITSHMFKNIENCDYAIISHFCNMENLFSVLSQYLRGEIISKMAITKITGENWYDSRDEDLRTSMVYLKTNSNRYLQIVINEQNYVGYKNENPFVWVKEADSIDDFLICEDDLFQFTGNSNLTIESLNGYDISKLNDLFDSFGSTSGSMNGVVFSDGVSIVAAIFDFMNEQDRIMYGNSITFSTIGDISIDLFKKFFTDIS